MKAVTKFLTAAAAAVTVMAGASAANAGVVFDQVVLTGPGTDFFGAVIEAEPGPFTHVFNFTLANHAQANSSLTTIRLGATDIDFSSIKLDGFSFDQIGFDPKSEVWELASVLLGSGPHSITVTGNVVGRSQGGSYSGVLNVAAVPEPATWALMIMGFAGAGAMMRRRRATAAFA